MVIFLSVFYKAINLAQINVLVEVSMVLPSEDTVYVGAKSWYKKA